VLVKHADQFCKHSKNKKVKSIFTNPNKRANIIFMIGFAIIAVISYNVLREILKG
jgi:preprotein translocase subunit Sec63